MSKTKIFCFGFGQVAESFINKLINEKKDFDLSVTSRQETHQIEFNNIKINSYQFTEDKFDNSIKKKIEEADYILVSIPPIDGKDIVANFLDTSNYRVKPTIGGYYQINASARCGTNVDIHDFILYLRKNEFTHAVTRLRHFGITNDDIASSAINISDIVHFNGVDDYIDFDDKLALKQDWPAVPSILNTSDVGENAKIKLAQIACQPLSLRKMVNTLHLLIIDAREADENNKYQRQLTVCNINWKSS